MKSFALAVCSNHWVQRLLLFLALPCVAFAGYSLAVLTAPRLDPASAQPQVLTVNGLFIEPASLDLGELWESPRHVVVLKVANLSGEKKVIAGFEKT